MPNCFRERIHTCPTEHEQEVADLKAQIEHWRTKALRLQADLGNVQVRCRRASDLIDRIIDEVASV